mmetsp:Transcript_53198/g.108243  ORF Transcript_53198/g.108243 Transcript_53198/m.108243 type:complete len:80 (+) Transcript_53198:1-240(+)
MKATPYADDDDVKTSAFAVEALAHSGCSNWRPHWFGSLNRFEAGLGFANSMEVLADESRCLPWANGRARRPEMVARKAC